MYFDQSLSFRLPVNGGDTSNYHKMGEGFETASNRAKSASLTNKQGISVRKVELHLGEGNKQGNMSGSDRIAKQFLPRTVVSWCNVCVIPQLLSSNGFTQL